MRTLRGAGWRAEVLATGGPGDARTLAEYGVADGVDVVAVFGGDGTTMQAAAALVGTDVALGVIPGRDREPAGRQPAHPRLAGARRARAGGRASRSRSTWAGWSGPAGRSISRWPAGRATTRGSWPERSRSTSGAGAWPPTSRRRSASSPISAAPVHAITIDGVEYDANAAMVLVANCGEVIPPSSGSGPGIRPDDGLLDVVVVRANSFSQSVRAVWDLLRDAPTAEGQETYVGYARGREIRVETDPVQPVQLDGEPGGETPFTASVVPGAIRIMVRRQVRHGAIAPSD